MVEDAVGEAIGGAAEVAIEALGDIGSPADSKRRRRRGCWRLLLIALVLAFIVWGVVAFSA
ncbi:hypothetical protein [Porphyrobacter sp. ULC335]|uniref:hypothetical protein n=1 Tax=Porphyrobacter sp. ULC335 TaxID=2854260 RepID=UPI0022211F2E|nr:hypothetical protein [Porphyrobacter sp. ULC335]UYV14305.1 hypothetical protein KVF90_08910 [Porphyrobacter sp. ULC335]